MSDVLLVLRQRLMCGLTIFFSLSNYGIDTGWLSVVLFFPLDFR